MADDRDRLEEQLRQQRRLQEQEQRLAPEESGGGWGWFGWWWFWLIILIFFVWFAGWGWWGYGGWWGWGAPRTYAVQYQRTVPDSLIVLTSPDKQAYIGKQVTLNNVRVQGSAGHNGFWVGPNGNHRLLVVGAANGHLKLQQGERVSVTGTVQRAPTVQQAQKQLGLSSDDANHLQQEGVYLQAGNLQASNGRQG